MLAAQAVGVLLGAADAVALGHGFGGFQHALVHLGALTRQRLFFEHEGVHVRLHQGDGFRAASGQDLALAGLDALRRQRHALQARGAKAVDAEARRGHRTTGAQRDQPRRIQAGGPFHEGGAADHVLHLAGLHPGALDGVAERVRAQGNGVGHVEPPSVRLGQRRAGHGDDDGVVHDGLNNVK